MERKEKFKATPVKPNKWFKSLASLTRDRLKPAP